MRRTGYAGTAGGGGGSVAETIEILRGMWTQDVFDFHGRTTRSSRTGTSRSRSSAPARRCLIGGWGNRMMWLIAEYADIWNISGPPHTDFAVLEDRVRRLDAECARIGRDPATVSRSLQQIVSYDEPAATRAIVQRAARMGFDHIVLSLPGRTRSGPCAGWSRRSSSRSEVAPTFHLDGIGCQFHRASGHM